MLSAGAGGDAHERPTAPASYKGALCSQHASAVPTAVLRDAGTAASGAGARAVHGAGAFAYSAGAAGLVFPTGHQADVLNCRQRNVQRGTKHILLTSSTLLLPAGAPFAHGAGSTPRHQGPGRQGQQQQRGKHKQQQQQQQQQPQPQQQQRQQQRAAVLPLENAFATLSGSDGPDEQFEEAYEQQQLQQRNQLQQRHQLRQQQQQQQRQQRPRQQQQHQQQQHIAVTQQHQERHQAGSAQVGVSAPPDLRCI